METGDSETGANENDLIEVELKAGSYSALVGGTADLEFIAGVGSISVDGELHMAGFYANLSQNS
ncbi:MAG: hypothetical protein PF692_15650 [Kiritimatiellae bacterium]|jgi:hypothetical protein|nr:hypothetical protein [Kiritimatiellia bacterium]